MNEHSLDDLVDKYYQRVDFSINLSNISRRTRNYEGQLKKYITNRANQLGTFLEDAKILFNLEGDENLTITNPRMKRGCLQYYSLEKTELIAYIGFRSKLRAKKVPKNPQVTFLVLYLMEVLNDLYSSNFVEKLRIVKDVALIFKKGAKFKKIIKEAYEVLYFQAPQPLTIERFKSTYNIDGIFEGFSQNPDEFDKYNYYYEAIIKKIDLSKIDEYLIKSSFKEVVQKLLEADFSIYNSGINIYLEDAIKVIYVKNLSLSLNKLYSVFPLQTEMTLYNNKGNRIVVSNGMLKYYKEPFVNYVFFEKLFEFLKNSFRKILNGPNIIRDDESKYYNSYFLRNKFGNEENEVQVLNAVRDWVNNNNYCQMAYKLSIMELERLKNQSNFEINLQEVNKIRVKSAKIQEKLIIEDDLDKNIPVFTSNSGNSAQNPDLSSNSYFESLKKLNNTQKTGISNKSHSGKKQEYSEINSVASGKTSNNSDNPYEKMVKNLTNSEYKVLKYLLSEDISNANRIAKLENVMLSLIIDNINLKATEYTQDIIIEDLCVIDEYKKEIVHVLS